MASSFRTRLAELEKKADDLSGEMQDLSFEISGFKDDEGPPCQFQTWTRQEWEKFDRTLDAHNYRDVPIEVDDPEGDPMGLSDVSEEGVDYDRSASEDERHQEEWRMKR